MRRLDKRDQKDKSSEVLLKSLSGFKYVKEYFLDTLVVVKSQNTLGMSVIFVRPKSHRPN